MYFVVKGQTGSFGNPRLCVIKNWGAWKLHEAPGAGQVFLATCWFLVIGTACAAL